MTERVTCETCRFWERLRETEPDIWIGECRRNTPALIVDYSKTMTGYEAGYQAKWVLTMFDDWCGEGKVKGQPND